MKTLQVNREQLSHGLKTVAGAIPSAPALPILSNIYLESTGKKIVLCATNLEVVISTKFVAEGEKFTTTVPAKAFVGLINAIQTEWVELAFDEEKNSLQIKTTSSKNNIKCINPGLGFPDLPKFSKKNMEFNSEAFRSAVSKVAFSAGTSELIQPVLTGMLMKSTEQGTVFTATNGYRLSKKSFDDTGDAEVIVPAKTILEVSKNFEQDVKIQIKERNIIFKSGETIASLLAISGNYVNLDGFVPYEENIIKVNTKEFYQACKQAAIFAPEDKFVLSFAFEGILGKVFAQADQVGDSLVNFTYTGAQDISLDMSASYILEYLTTVSGESIEISVKDSSSPVFFRSEEEGYFHMIMPIKQ